MTRVSRWTLLLAIMFLPLLVHAGPAAAQASTPPLAGDLRRPAGSEGAPGEGLVLGPAITPPVGAEGYFLIGERLLQGLANRTGAFADVPAEQFADVEQDLSRAVRVYYRMLPPDPATGSPRVLAAAMPVDPSTGTSLQSAPWEAVYLLLDGEARLQEGDAVPEEYRVLVEPQWLAGWPLTPPDQLPRQALAPGAGWQAIPTLDVSNFPFGRLQPVGPLEGRFVGWESLPGAPGSAAHVMETVRGASADRQELAPGVPADVSFAVDLTAQWWLIPGDFPAQGRRGFQGTMDMVVDPRSGAPAALEGSLTFAFVYERIMVREPEPETGSGGASTPVKETGQASQAPGPPVLRRGQAVTGFLGSGSQLLDDGVFVDLYELQGVDGQRADIRLESNEFDAFLFLINDLNAVVAYDDDSGGGTNARIQYTFPYTGTYWILVASFSAGETGAYRLSVD